MKKNILFIVCFLLNSQFFVFAQTAEAVLGNQNSVPALSTNTTVENGSSEASFQQKIDYQKKQIHALTAKVNTLQSENQDLRQSQAAVADSKALEAEILKNTNELKAMKAELALALSAKQSLEKEKAVYLSTIETLNKVKSDSEKNSEADKLYKVNAEKEKNGLISTVQSLQTKVQQLAAERDAKSLSEAKAKEQAAQAFAERDQSMNDLKKLQGIKSEQETFKAQIKTLSEQADKLRAKDAQASAPFEAQIRQSRSENEALKLKVKDLESQVLKLKANESKILNKRNQAIEEQFQNIKPGNSRVVSVPTTKAKRFRVLLHRLKYSRYKIKTFVAELAIERAANRDHKKIQSSLNDELAMNMEKVSKFKSDFESFMDLTVSGMQERLERQKNSRNTDELKKSLASDLEETKNFQSNMKLSLESLLMSMGQTQEN